MPFVREPGHWLKRFSPDEWIQVALGELRRAEARLSANDVAAGIAGCKRAAGMALNGALLVEPNESWGRSYVDHIAALAGDRTVPDKVRGSCAILVDAKPPGSTLVMIRGPREGEKLLDATRDVMAHAYAVIKRHEVEGE